MRLLLLILAALLLVCLDVEAKNSNGKARGRRCGRLHARCCGGRSCRRGLKCRRGYCKRVPPSCPGRVGEPCCTTIADAGPCVGGAICNSPDAAAGTCVPCGGKGQLACFVITIAGESGPICDSGLRATTSDPPRCSPNGNGPPCSGTACPPPNPSPNGACNLGTEGEPCCFQIADTNGCEGGLTCDEGTCVPCGGPGEEPCFACPQGPFGPCNQECDDGSEPIEESPGAFVCPPADGGGGSGGEPSCPGLVGEPCCTFIADAGPCARGAICDSEDTASGTCIACGGNGELACFETSLLGSSGPICDDGLRATRDEPPRCAPNGNGPPCSGPACPPTGPEPPAPCDLGTEGEPCCTLIADTNGCRTGLACRDRICVSCGGPGEDPCFVCPQGPFGPCTTECDDGAELVETLPGTFECPDSSAPSCPGQLDEPCCTTIADAGPCVGGAECNSTNTAKGTCVACGGNGENACFVITIAGSSGPICDDGLRATTDDPPKCSPNGTGPDCSGTACPPPSS